MPFLVLVAGLLILVTAIRGSQGDFFALVEGDLGGFAKWMAAIIGIGLLGYIPDMQTPSRLLLAIVFFVIIAKNNGVFQTAAGAFGAPPAPSKVSQPVTSSLGPVPVQVNVSGGGGGLGGLTSIFNGNASNAASGIFGTTGTGGL